MNGEHFDPDRYDAELVAAFEQRPVAERARDALLNAGLPAHIVELVGADAAEPPDASQGFWHAVRRLFAPAEEAHALAEALGRGHVMVVVRPETERERETAIEVLEGCGPIDFEAPGGPGLNRASPSGDAEEQVGGLAPDETARPSFVRIVEERLRPGWRDRSGRSTRVRSYVAERETLGHRVELHEEEIRASTDRPGV